MTRGRQRFLAGAIPLIASLALLAVACGSSSDDPVADSTEIAADDPTGAAEEPTGAAEDPSVAVGEPTSTADSGGEVEYDEPASAFESTPTPIQIDPEVEYDPEGRLRFAIAFTNTGSDSLSFDPVDALRPNANEPFLAPIYDSLLRTDTTGALVPSLAESVEVIDPSTIAVELREGLTFSDGTPLDAEAARASIERNRDSEQRGQFSTALQTVSSIDVSSPTMFTINLSEPLASAFYPLLAQIDTYIVAPAAIASGDASDNPIGAGPFLLEGVEPAERVVYVKNENYWDADNIRLQYIEIHNLFGPTTVISALSTGQIDFAAFEPEAIDALNTTDLRVQTRGDESGLVSVLLCKGDGPLTDVRVRTALNVAIDREGLNQVLFNGMGDLAWGMFPTTSELFDEGLEDYFAYDLDRARSLLAEAGHGDGVDLSMVSLIPGPAAGTIAEILQAQWLDVGVDLSIETSADPVSEFLIAEKFDMALTTVVPPGMARAEQFEVDSFANCGDFAVDEMYPIVDQLKAAPLGSPEAAELWHTVQRMINENALVVNLVFTPAVSAWNDEAIAGVQVIPETAVFPDYRSIYVPVN